MVVIEDPVRVAPPIVLEPPPSLAEIESFPPHVVLPLPEREAIELLLRRRDLSHARRLELAEMIAPTLRARLGMKTGDPVRFLAVLHQVVVGATVAGQVSRKGARR
jgi:hypothetical protein